MRIDYTWCKHIFCILYEIVSPSLNPPNRGFREGETISLLIYVAVDICNLSWVEEGYKN